MLFNSIRRGFSRADTENLTGPAKTDFDETYRRHYPSVYRYLRRMTGGDDAAAEDLAQETFSAYFSASARVEDAKIRAWLYKTAHNQSANHKRRALYEMRKRNAAADIAEAGAVETDGPDAKKLLAALVEVPAKYRSCLVLYYLEGKPLREVATILDMPLGTVKSHLHRGLKLLAPAARRLGLENGLQ